MKIFEVIDRKAAEKIWSQTIAPRPVKQPASAPASDTRVHTIRRSKSSDQPSGVSMDTWQMNRLMDRQLKKIKTVLQPTLEQLISRTKKTARDFGHNLPADWLSPVNHDQYFFPPPESPLHGANMFQRYKDLIGAYEARIKQLKQYLKYPKRYRY